jgi:RNA polymerase sigma-70 factor (ECF subfamily)
MTALPMPTTLPADADADADRPPPALPADAADRARFQRMVGDHFDFIWRSLRRLGAREGDVDDLAQKVFFTAASKLRQIRPGAERSFLFAVALREAGHARRSYRRRGEVGEEAIADKSTGSLRPDELAGRAEGRAFIAAALDAMDDELRAVFVLFELEEMSAAEIAELLGIPVGTAKSRLRRAREDFALRTAALRSAGAAT